MFLQTRDDVVEYVRARLGHPVIDLELDLQAKDGLGHVHLAIQDSLDWMFRHAQDEANYKDFLVIRLKTGIMEYTLPKDISDVVDVKQTWGGFTPWMAFDVGAGESLVATTFFGGNQFDLVTYAAGQRYLADVKKLVGQSYQVHYHPASNVMRIYPTPKEDRFVLMEVFRKDYLSEVFSMINFRDLVVARTRYIWGTILMKDENIVIPGGGKVNGSGVLALAEKELEKIETRIRDESSPPMIRFG